MNKIITDIIDKRIILNDVLYVSGYGKILGEYIIEYMTKNMTEPEKIHLTDEDKYNTTLSTLNNLLINKSAT